MPFNTPVFLDAGEPGNHVIIALSGGYHTPFSRYKENGDWYIVLADGVTAMLFDDWIAEGNTLP